MSVVNLTKITEEELSSKRLSGLPDTPGFSALEMQKRFDAHPDRNTEVINENAEKQEKNNAAFDKRITDAESDLLNKVEKIPGKGLSEAEFTNAEKSKLSSIEEGANSYTLPPASRTSLGGIKVGKGFHVFEDGTLDLIGTFPGGEDGVYIGSGAIIKEVKIYTTAWKKTEASVQNNGFTALVEDVDSRVSCYPIAAVEFESLGTAQEAGLLSFCETLNGSIKFMAKKIPADVLKICVLLIFENGSTQGGSVAAEMDVNEVLNSVFGK